MRKVPDIKTAVTEGYAIPIGHNYDTVQETYNLTVPDALADRLQLHKELAMDNDSPMDFSFGGEAFQIWIGASQGKKWVIENDDFQIHFGSPKQAQMQGWAITVRYLSAGLWEHKFEKLKKRVLDAFWKECLPICAEAEKSKPETWQRVSRVDYAFDFYSQKFTREMAMLRIREKVLAPSGVKLGTVGTSLRDETLTIGFSRPGLVIQVYDKGQEITDMSGKTWMFKVWEREGYHPPEDKRAKDCWRVEVRFGKKFLKDRKILTFEQMREGLQELLAEALFTRRLVQPGCSETRHRERWALHPLWAAVYSETEKAGTYLPIGRQVTLRRDAMKAVLDSQISGCIRAKSVLTVNDYDSELGQHIAEDCADAIPKDPEHKKKVQKSIERYRHIDEAK